MKTTINCLKQTGLSSRFVRSAYVCTCAVLAGCFILLNSSCTKTEPEPLADIQKLQGEWKSTDFPLAVTVQFTSTDTLAKITAVATNTYSIKTGDIFWRSVVPTGANTFRLGQLTKSTSGYYVFVAGTATLSADNKLEIIYSGDSDDVGQLKLSGKKATFTKQ